MYVANIFLFLPPSTFYIYILVSLLIFMVYFLNLNLVKQKILTREICEMYHNDNLESSKCSRIFHLDVTFDVTKWAKLQQEMTHYERISNSEYLHIYKEKAQIFPDRRWSYWKKIWKLYGCIFDNQQQNNNNGNYWMLPVILKFSKFHFGLLFAVFNNSTTQSVIIGNNKSLILFWNWC